MARVLISYAWESDTFRQEIWDLAGWIQAAGQGRITVITDHLHQHRPPIKGWPAWMEDEIENSDVVLSVCTPKYHSRFSKKDVGDTSGIGVTLEGALITQWLQEGKLLNSKFFPILPEWGSIKDIPRILRPFNNGHWFPKGNEGILKLILNDNPTHALNDISASVSIGISLVNLENEVACEFLKDEGSQIMVSPIHIIIRSFLSLSEIDKINIAKSIDIFSIEYEEMTIPNRDKEIFRRVKAEKKLAAFWDALNLIKPFDNNQNPFK